MTTRQEDNTLSTAISIVSETGLETLSVRALAERCGTSPSLISYHFGSKQGLVEALANYVATQQEQIWSDRLSQLPTENLPLVSLSGLAMGLLIDNAVSYRDLMRTMWALQVHGLRESDGENLPPVSGAGASYWERVLRASGLSAELAGGLDGTLESVGHILLINDPTPDLYAWCADIIHLQFALLAEVPLPKPRLSTWRAAYAPPTSLKQVNTPDASTRTKIIAAAKRIIQTDGYRALSHREIARRSGVSLSSTTHHFSSLDDIMFQAYWTMFDDIAPTVREFQTDDQPQTMHEYIERVLPKLSEKAQSSGLSHIVFEELLLVAAQKPELREIGLSLFASMGETTYALMGSLPEADFGRLEAHLFRHVLRGVALQTSLGVSDVLTESLRLFLETTFASPA